MSEIQQVPAGKDLAVSYDQGWWTEEQLAALQQVGLEKASRADLTVFLHYAKETGLDPFRREIYMIYRWDKKANAYRSTIQTGIDGFYKIAERVSRQTGGTWSIPETSWCGPDGVWVDAWLHRQPPAAAKVTMVRDGNRFTTVALLSEYAADNTMWRKMPSRMLAKCAEALAIRKAFPEVMSGLYTAEEMQQATTAEQPVRTPQAPQTPPVPERGTRKSQQQVRKASPPVSPPAAAEPVPQMSDAEVEHTQEAIAECEDLDDLRVLYSSVAQQAPVTGELREAFMVKSRQLTEKDQKDQKEQEG